MTEIALNWKGGPVPADYFGLWERRLLETPDGGRDTDTMVRWLQSQHFYIDHRLPAGRPDFSTTTDFGDLSVEQAAYLATQEGFAGSLEYANENLAWRRHIDFRPAGGPPDEGRMERRSQNFYIETGLHAEYLEEWEQVLDRDQLPANLGEGWFDGVLIIRADTVFMRAQDNRPASPPTDLREAVRARPEKYQELLDCEISFGHTEGYAKGRITHSTIPWLEGTLIDLSPLEETSE